MKRMNRKLELLYRRAEFLTSWLSENGQWIGTDELKDGWKIILRNQFHDIIPGSSIHEVYEDAKEEYNEAYELVRNVESRILQQGVEEGDRSVVLFNATQHQGKKNVTVPQFADFAAGVWKDSKGEVLTHQKRDNGWIIEVDTLPSFGAKTLYFEPVGNVQDVPANFNYQDRKLETPYYLVEWNEYGQMTSLFDKEAGRQVLAENQKGNVLQIFEDKPLAHDAWDIDLFYQEKWKKFVS